MWYLGKDGCAFLGVFLCVCAWVFFFGGGQEGRYDEDSEKWIGTEFRGKGNRAEKYLVFPGKYFSVPLVAGRV